MRLILGGMAESAACRGLCAVSRPLAETRHAARRILAPAVLDELARLIRPGGMLVLASDHPVAKGWLAEIGDLAHRLRLDGAAPAGLAGAAAPAGSDTLHEKAEREDRVPNWFMFERCDMSEFRADGLFLLAFTGLADYTTPTTCCRSRWRAAGPLFYWAISLLRDFRQWVELSGLTGRKGWRTNKWSNRGSARLSRAPGTDLGFTLVRVRYSGAKNGRSQLQIMAEPVEEREMTVEDCES